MEILTLLANGFATAFTPTNLFYCFLGVTVGTFIGVLPGVGAMLGIALLLPATFYLPPETAIIMLAGIYYGGEYGGAITSILINVPGSTSSAITALEGNKMAKQGRAAVALFVSAIASFIGGSFGIVLMILFSPAISRFALSLGSADYFAIMVLGLVAGAFVAKGSLLKALIAVVLGMLFGMIGTDVSTGVQRYTFGVPELVGGLDIALVAMALFGIPEIVTATAEPKINTSRFSLRLQDMLPTRDDVRRSVNPVARGSVLGSLLGILPGTGATIASFMSYTTERRISREPGRFGKGAIEGVVGPEAANNAAAQTSFIPTLAIGIPGTPTMALMLGALMIQGIPPGPEMMTLHADLFWALIASFWIGNILLLVLNIPLVGVWAKLANIPHRFLFPAIICLIAVGVYSSTLNTFDVYLVLAIGVLGCGMALAGFEAAPFLMGFILGPMMEENLRRAMQLGRGDPMLFLSRPVSLICLIIALVILLAPVIGFARAATRLHRQKAQHPTTR